MSRGFLKKFENLVSRIDFASVIATATQIALKIKHLEGKKYEQQQIDEAWECTRPALDVPIEYSQAQVVANNSSI